MALDRTTLVTGVTVLAALAVGSAITARLPQPEAVREAPFVVVGRVGQALTLRTGTVSVEGVDASTKVTDGSSHAVSAHGVFVVLTLTWQPSSKPLPTAEGTVVASDGRRYTGGSPVTGSCSTTQPTLRIRCQQVFELPGDALVGARLELPADPSGRTEGDQVAQVDLGIDDSQAAALRARTDELTIRRSAPAGPA